MKARDSRTRTCSVLPLPCPWKPSSPPTSQILHWYPLPHYRSPLRTLITCLASPSESCKTLSNIAHDGAPFASSHLHLHLHRYLYLLKRYNAIQKPEQHFECLRRGYSSPLIFDNVESGECVACRVPEMSRMGPRCRAWTSGRGLESENENMLLSSDASSIWGTPT